MNKIQEVERLNKTELDMDIPFKSSWHRTYENCPWVFFGGLSTDLSEGDIICMFSQWGEVEDINLVRDHDTGKSKGFGFLRYENWLSTVLAVDNFNGMELLGRLVCVDHKKDYRPPKEEEPESRELHHHHHHRHDHRGSSSHSHRKVDKEREHSRDKRKLMHKDEDNEKKSMEARKLPSRKRSFSSEEEKPKIRSNRSRSFSDSLCVC